VGVSAFPAVLGWDLSGTVVAGPRAGDEVFGMPRFPALAGAYAEYVVAPADQVVRKPDHIDHRTAAAAPMVGITAWQTLFRHGGLTRGQRVLVHGAAGGVGTAVLQVAKGLGATTIAVVSTDAKEAVAREAGADHVLRSGGAWKDEAKALGGADLVFDPVGGSRFTDSIRSLKEGGRVVVIGFTEGSIPEVKVNRLLLGNTEVVGAGWGAYAMAKPQYVTEVGAAIDGLIAGGHVKPIVGATFPLENAREALELIDGRGATGKVVLDLA
jgi:NADPH2:quinone reductase